MSKGLSRFFFFVLVTIIAFIYASYGRKKGYSYWGCFLCCMMGNIVGIAVVLLLPDIVQIDKLRVNGDKYQDKEIDNLRKEIELLRKEVEDLKENATAN